MFVYHAFSLANSSRSSILFLITDNSYHTELFYIYDYREYSMSWKFLSRNRCLLLNSYLKIPNLHSLLVPKRNKIGLMPHKKTMYFHTLLTSAYSRFACVWFFYLFSGFCRALGLKGHRFGSLGGGGGGLSIKQLFCYVSFDKRVCRDIKYSQM